MRAIKADRRFTLRSLAASALIFGLALAAAPRPAMAEELAERVDKLEAKVNEITKEETSKDKGITLGGFRFQPYGFIKVDACHDDSRAFNGDFIAWVLQETNSPSDLRFQARPDTNEFSLTANQSRLDLKVVAPKYNDIETTGLFEIDFYGNVINRVSNTVTELGGPDNKPSVLVRHAFVEMKQGTWGLLLGQTHDPISLQWCDTWNYFVGWNAGNPGYRRPQVRVTKDVPLGDGSRIALWTGFMRTIEDLKFTRAGEDVGWPTLFARAAWQKPMFGKELLVAASGHYGKEEVQSGSTTLTPPAVAGEARRQIESWSGNLELIVPLPHGLWLKGEGFYGETLGNYFAGIGQSFNPDSMRGIHSWGGWGQLGWVASDKLRFHAGATIDNPRNGDLIRDSESANRFTANRSLNRSFYGNFMYNLTPAVTVGYEISHWLTQYSDGNGNGTDLRHQVSAMYKF
ncbi:MAG: hypothetical protein V2A77_11445 [Pseudomonadota bacterium]